MGNPNTLLNRLKEVDYTQAGDRGGSTNAATIYPDRQFAVVPLISAGTETRTVSAPRKSGLIFTLDMVTDGGDITVTVTGGYDEAGSTTLTFSAIGQFATLVSIEQTSGTFVWRLLGYDGVTGPVVALGAGAFDSITGTDSSLGVTGQAAAQGGAVALTGGTSSTSGNAGGAVTATGGTPGATGVGGAVTFVGGIGGATSGAGGAVSLTGGAGTGVTTAGGAASIAGGIGGTGTTTSAGGVGGALSITSGAGGAKTGTGAAAGGAAGALTVTGGVGGATASSGSDAGGAGSSVTITSGAGGAASAGTGAGGAGGASSLIGGAGGTSAGGAGGAGGAITITGGASGTGTAAAGGAVAIAGGAASATNGAGGSVTLAGGAPNGTGARGTVTATGLITKAGTTGVAITGATALTQADSGGIFTVAQSSTYDIDLPSPTTGPGLEFLFSLTAPGAFAPTITVLGGAATFVGAIITEGQIVVATGSTLTFASGVAVLGDFIHIRSIATNLYHVQAVSSILNGITVA